MTTAEQLISDRIPFVLDTDSVSSVLGLMRNAHSTQLPLLSDTAYLGLINEEDLLQVDNAEKTITEAAVPRLKAAIAMNSHPYDVLKLMAKFDLQVLPVIDRDGAFTGVIDQEMLIDYIANQESTAAAGGILVLEVHPINYSLAEIARICESNQATILKSSVYTNPETGQLEVTLKLNSTELQYVIATFERYEYTVLHVFGDDATKAHLSDRYDLLMNYLNM